MQNTLLQQHFPMIRTRSNIQAEIQTQPYLSHLFSTWKPQDQEDFLAFCSGARGVKMLYDGFAKEILNPETHPERLNELLSLILGRKVTILQVLPNDNTRIADESSLLLMDIVVRLEDGSIANVEVQKIGYMFPGQRCACYSADLLLRQYKMLHSQKTKDKFSYRDMKSVYTIVFFEKSSQEFHAFPDDWRHHFGQKSDTGLELDLLQEYYLIPLDIFLHFHQNKTISNRLDAWLMFLSSDKPEDIIAVIDKYPEFKAMYEQIYDICQNTEKVMEMFSKELLEMDRNTVRYMIDEMQSEIDQKTELLEQANNELKDTEAKLSDAQSQLNTTTSKLVDTRSQLTDTQSRLTDTQSRLTDTQSRLTDTQSRLTDTQSRLTDTQSKLSDAKTKLNDTQSRLTDTQSQLTDTQCRLTDTQSQLTDTQSRLTDTQSQLTDTQSRLTDTQSQLTDTQSRLTDTQSQLELALQRIAELENR